MEYQKNLPVLPDELLLEIFSYFSVEELALTVQHVNTHWQELSQDDTLWKDLVFKPGDNMSTVEIIRHLKNMPSLRSFKATEKSDITRVIGTMSRFCRHIQNIEFNWANKLNASIMKEIVYNLPNIKSLSLPVSDWSFKSHEEAAIILGQCHSLTSLCLTGMVCSPWIPGILKHIAEGCPSLQHVDLHYVCFSQEDMTYFLEAKKDQLLTFKVNSLESSLPYKALACCTKLENLHMFNTVDIYPPQTEFNFLSNLTNIKDLSLHKFQHDYLHYVRDLFVNGTFSQIVTLELCLNYFLDALILAPILRNGAQLQRLVLSHNRNISDDSFCDIGSCHQLRYLNLEGCGLITDKTLEHVSAGCHKLKYLNISYCYQLSDNAVRHIVHCRNLTVLKVMSTRFTGSYFHLIPSHLVHLVELNVRHCAKLSESILVKLQKDLPHLRIVREYIDELRRKL